MRIKAFDDKKIVIRKIGGADKKNARVFLTFINSIITEESKILMNKKMILNRRVRYQRWAKRMDSRLPP